MLAANTQVEATPEDKLQAALDHAAHYLPDQGPIGVFVHHNTLHAFQHLPFHEAIAAASALYQARPYLEEAEFRRLHREGRITTADIDAALEEVGAVLAGAPAFAEGPLLDGLLTRAAARRLALLYPLEGEAAAGLRWQQEELTPPPAALWAECERVSAAGSPPPPRRLGYRERLLRAVGADLDALVNPVLIRTCAVYLDEGVAYWPLPGRERGYYHAVRELLSLPLPSPTRWLRAAEAEFAAQRRRGATALAVVLETLAALGVPDEEWSSFVLGELLALPGWSGMMWRLERRPADRPDGGPPASLLELLAVRLTLERLAAEHLAAERGAVSLGAAVAAEPELVPVPLPAPLTRATRLLRLCEAAGLSAAQLAPLGAAAGAELHQALEAFDDLQRRRVWQEAYERHHRHQVLDALAAQPPPPPAPPRPRFQIVLCIDDREESLRRALEELGADYETFAAAGFFGLAIDFQGLEQYRPVALCPVALQPTHGVVERPHPEDARRYSMWTRGRRLWSRFAAQLLVGSRSLVRGTLLSASLGVAWLVPLVSQVLFPRRTAKISRWVRARLLPRPRTQLQGDEAGAGGFSVEEQAQRVAALLENLGLRGGHAPLVLLLGHGASSANNPHSSAYECGACGGRQGGANARLFASMANREDVRALLRQRGVDIPAGTRFLGGLHNTSSDEVTLYDDIDLPPEHQALLRELRAGLDQARAQNAQERCRRFVSAPAVPAPAAALRHVEERVEDLAQPRTEAGHATNAVCLVGRRARSRGLFLDRRAFLVSYDPASDPHGTILERILAAVVPVGAGINLEYYFSRVDNERYGCGTKLPHNVTGLLGVMNGHASDLRTGLPWQMVEIHEPVRLLAVVEAAPAMLLAIAERQPEVRELVVNRWIQLVSQDPESGQMQVFSERGFQPYTPAAPALPEVTTSAEWFLGHPEHLAPARVVRAVLQVRRTRERAMLPEAGPVLYAQVAIGAPALGFLVMGALLLLGRPLGERATARLTAVAQLLSLGGAVALCSAALLRSGASLTLELGDWYHMAGYSFPITLLIDALSGPMMVLTALICGVVGRFSVTYLHREPGFHRFFLLMLLFNAAMLLLVSAGSIDLLFAGWELVGLSSVLLIAFFNRREGPVQSSLRAFVIYRSCDIGLLLGAVLLHHYAHSSQFGAALGVSWPLPTAHLSGGPANLIALLFVLASLGKSAQVPLTGWLPRAMEGPTPSSALFYGALSVHAGAYLLLRTAPLLQRAPLASGLLVLLGLLTAVQATASGRVQADAKNALAYASATQVGVIFVEIGLGFYLLAMVHMMGHICVRSFQLLRAPSLVQETHELRLAAGAHHLHTGRHFEMILPARLRLWLYRLALERFYLDALLDEYVVRPVLVLARACDRAHLWLDALVAGSDKEGRS